MFLGVDSILNEPNYKSSWNIYSAWLWLEQSPLVFLNNALLIVPILPYGDCGLANIILVFTNACSFKFVLEDEMDASSS